MAEKKNDKVGVHIGVCKDNHVVLYLDTPEGGFQAHLSGPEARDIGNALIKSAAEVERKLN